MSNLTTTTGFDLRIAWRSLEFGRYWKEEITHGRGISYSSNLKAEQKFKYHHDNGLGMVSHDDPEKVTALARVISYITKSDASVILKVPGQDRVFTRSCVRKKKRVVSGRPRQNATVKVPYDKINPFHRG